MVYQLTQAIATGELVDYLENQVQLIAPEPAVIQTPQHKARYHDKNRLRWNDAKTMALSVTGCLDTSEIKKWLKTLNVRSLSLRMTSGWVAVRQDLATKIKLAKNRIMDMIAPQVNSASQGDRTQHIPTDPVVTVLNAMKTALATSNWDFARRALVGREQYKTTAWAMLSATEKKQLNNIVPPALRLLKQAVKSGAIAAFKEHEEGGLFWIWETEGSDPDFLTGAGVSRFLQKLCPGG